MEAEFRQLNDRERALLEKLIEAEPSGRSELRAQLSSVTCKQIYRGETLKLRCNGGHAYPGKQALVREGWCKDADGMTISVMLHVDAVRFMHMLEIYRPDGMPVINPPTADALVPLLPEDRGRKPDAAGIDDGTWHAEG
jgi:hypothetical protein